MHTPPEPVADREILCPECGQTHLVKNSDWWDGERKVRESEAVSVAHWRAYYATKARTTEFVLFEPRATTPTRRRRRT